MSKGKKYVEVPVDSVEQVQNKPTGFVYPEYDLWETYCQTTSNTAHEVVYKFTCVKKLRTKVKIEDNVAVMMNNHSHTTNQKYYLSDSVTNGNEETVTIKK